MIIYLDPDIIRLIASNLDYNILDDLLNLSVTCKYTNYALDNIFFQNIANQLYSSEFWSKAKLRPSITSKPLPTIKKCSRVANGKVYHWELVDGFHRHTAMERNHVQEYWFRVVDHTDLDSCQIIGSQLKQNDHKDHEKLGVDGVANALSTLIDGGDFGKKENITFNMLRTYLDKYLKNVRTDTKDRGIRKSLKQNGVPTDVNVLDGKEKTDFVNLNGNYKLKGKMDKQRGALGWDCLQGYEDRIIKGLGNMRPLIISTEISFVPLYKDSAIIFDLGKHLYDMGYIMFHQAYRSRSSPDKQLVYNPYSEVGIPLHGDAWFMPRWTSIAGAEIIKGRELKYQALMKIFGMESISKYALKNINRKL